MPFYDSNTYVMRVADIDRVKEFFENFGLSFVKEQHGDGPVHYACEVAGSVLEIYPRRKK